MQRKDGTYCGGPMVTLTRAFPGSGWRRCWLCFCRKHRAGISRNGQYDAGKLDCAGDAGYVWRGKRKSALVLTILLLLVVTGGLRSIAKAAEVLVPGMALFYLGGAGMVIGLHAGELPRTLLAIVRDAFSFRAVSGGAVGAGISCCRRPCGMEFPAVCFRMKQGLEQAESVLRRHRPTIPCGRGTSA